ncbi:alanine--tRNA ligase [Oscillospiraceae bacterium LTW-04]|nr:alanine--tRNA ligase [Oscillospiraceae bacterium MB24-C1]
MEWTGLNELRSKFLNFFESKGHILLPSAPLVPRDDNSLLLINSGMAPLKKYFTGMETPPRKRATSCQKCIRTPDIENVGKTARHGTYFEMLGNFSFGDYFKHEATAWAWEFLTTELQIPKDLLWVTIYEDDDEAKDIWINEVGVSPDRIIRMGKEDNFWEIGSGPCGPCSELHFDRGEKYGCGSPDCCVGCECDRYIEIWNLVFTQFNSDGNGNYTPLDHPNIDTGMGLERLACVMQGVDNLFEVDTVQRIMSHISKIAGVTYKDDPKTDISLRVITDHVRSTTMMIGDGVVPSNEGRGYVLRRLLRRAARHGRLLGITEPFLYQVVDTVIEENKVAYPGLVDTRDYIVKVVKMEEERFSRTIDSGMELLSNIIDRIESEAMNKDKRVLPGDLAFKLYDTFGFPVDLTREILEEKQIGLDEEAFKKLMAEQRDRARKARENMGDVSWEDDVLATLDSKTSFVGYTANDIKCKVVAIVSDGTLADAIGTGDRAAIVLDTTPFYAESGGQVGDAGVISDGKAVFHVYDCKKSPTGQFLHIGEVVEGSLLTGSDVTAVVTKPRRSAIMRNHTAAHLLQFALREVLGTHVHQAGQLVDSDYCRFDFTHFASVTPEELSQIEALVNDMIFSALSVTVAEMSQDEAKQKGAMALFSEKYGDTVRVVDIDGRAIELCGGTHVDNTAKLGIFKILKESSVAAGVRRIEAVTGSGVLGYINQLQSQIASAAELLKIGSGADLAGKIGALQSELKAKEREIDSMSQRLATSQIKNLFESAKDIDGIRVMTASFNDMTPDALRALGDKVKEYAEPVMAVFTSASGAKASVLAVASKAAAQKGAHAGKLIKSLTTMAGGSGGGKPDSAMGGAPEIVKLNEAVSKVENLLRDMLTK